ncbi:MAG TPA: hypothetical protein VKH81_04360 [Candidatus Angelobacter sp.]|nr:hypothetical protein [Candidatus Angelobacter sp.]
MNKLDPEEAIARRWQRAHLRHFFGVSCVTADANESVLDVIDGIEDSAIQQVTVLDSEEAISRRWQEAHLRHFFGPDAVMPNSSESEPSMFDGGRKVIRAVGAFKHGRRKSRQLTRAL